MKKRLEIEKLQNELATGGEGEGFFEGAYLPDVLFGFTEKYWLPNRHRDNDRIATANGGKSC